MRFQRQVVLSTLWGLSLFHFGTVVIRCMPNQCSFPGFGNMVATIYKTDKESIMCGGRQQQSIEVSKWVFSAVVYR